MARIARIVIPGIAHHVTQRGNHKEKVFLEDGDHARYRAFLKEGAEKSATSIWAYCLMPNHVHIIAAPSHPDGLRALFADAHRRYTNYINWRHGWTGHLWQGRFGSVAMDEDHLVEAVRYVLLNPVRAGLTQRAEDWPHSSIQAHLSGMSDGLVDTAPLAARFGDLRGLLAEETIQSIDALRRSERSGRPLGRDEWVKSLEKLTDRRLLPSKRGPKPR
jgi:putative transposase